MIWRHYNVSRPKWVGRISSVPNRASFWHDLNVSEWPGRGWPINDPLLRQKDVLLLSGSFVWFLLLQCKKILKFSYHTASKIQAKTRWEWSECTYNKVTLNRLTLLQWPSSNLNCNFSNTFEYERTIPGYVSSPVFVIPWNLERVMPM